MTRHIAIASCAVLVVLAAPASAQVAQQPADVTRIETAVVELAKLKHGSESQVATHRRAAESALGACRTRGRGWARIRAVRDRAQRNAYARGAKALWADLRETAAEGAWVEVYTPHFERFLRRFDTPLSDPLLQAGIDAQRKRLAFDKAAYSFGTCATFNRVMKKVREFKVGGSHGVQGDYSAGKIYNDFVRYVCPGSAPRPARTGATATTARSTPPGISSRPSAAIRATRATSRSPSRAEPGKRGAVL